MTRPEAAASDEPGSQAACDDLTDELAPPLITGVVTANSEDETMDWTLDVVILPVTDVDRAKEFYSEKLGFSVDVDRRMSESFRVVQMTPPGSACSITIGEGLGDSPPGSARPQLCVADIEAAHAELVRRGAEERPAAGP